jgi:hypothetical protein
VLSGSPLLRLIVLYSILSLGSLVLMGVLRLTFRDGIDLTDVILIFVATSALAGVLYLRRRKKAGE